MESAQAPQRLVIQLLGDFRVSVASRAIDEREWLSGLRVTLLVELAGVQEQTGDCSAAIETLQQAVASDPVHEEAQGLLMRLLVQAGRRHLALRQYQALQAALQRELDAEP